MFATTLKFIKAVLFLIVALLLACCQKSEVVEVDVLSISTDSTLLSMQKITITLMDSNGSVQQVLFDDSLSDISVLTRLRLTTTYRGRILLTIKGEKAGVVVYEEMRRFDLGSQELIDAKVVFDAEAHISRPPIIIGLPSQVEVLAGDTLRLSATVRDSDGVIVYYAWNFSSGIAPDTLVTIHDSNIAVFGSHIYGTAGSKRAILEISDSMSVVKDTVFVTVRPRESGGLPLEAFAGVDDSVSTDSLVSLHGVSVGGLGPIVKYEWKLGAGALTQTASGDTVALMPSLPGVFTAVFKVTDSSGQSDVDSIFFEVGASANARLSALDIGEAILDPAFKAETEIYTASVPWEVSKLSLRGTAQHNAASVKVGLAYLKPGDATQIDLSVGENPIEVTVHSQNGVQKSYRVKVYRRKNTDTRLAALDVDPGALSPNFHSDTIEYDVRVGNEVKSVLLMATSTDSIGATMGLVSEGVPDTITLQTSKPSTAQNLEVGTRAFELWVKAQDGLTRKRYRIAVTREASPNATLMSLVPSVGALRPDFKAMTAEYFDTVGFAQDTMQLVGVPFSDKATVYQGGQMVAPGVNGPVTRLVVGDNTLSITIKAESGDTNVYRVRVHRKSNEARLANLVSSVGGLKGFAPDVVSYKDTVGPDVAGVKLSPTLMHTLGSNKIQGLTVASGSVSDLVPLNDGDNTIEILSTSEDGNTKVYTLAVYRISGNSTLETLDASAGKWGSMAMPAITAYKDTVVEAVGKFAVRARGSYGKAKVFVMGNEVTQWVWSDSLTLVDGEQTVKVKVIAENGDSTVYTLELYRTNANAGLSSLSINSVGLVPVFSESTLTYSDTLDYDSASISIIGSLKNNKASIVKVGKREVSLKSLSELVFLPEGTDTIPIVVRAEQGNFRTYRLLLTRKFHPASLSVLDVKYLSSGKRQAVFDSTFDRNRLFYKERISEAEVGMEIAVTPIYPGATITINGLLTIESKPKSLANYPGANIHAIKITASNGTTRTYTLNIYKPKGFTRNFGGGISEVRRSVPTMDGGFELMGDRNNGSRSRELFLIRVNAHGDSLWSKDYGTVNADYGVDMQLLSDKGLIVLGSSNLSSEILLVRTDAAADPIWTKTFLVHNTTIISGVTATSDGGFVVVGTAKVPGDTSFTYRGVFLMKVDASGAHVWQKVLNLGKAGSGSSGKSIKEAEGGDLIIAGMVNLGNQDASLLFRANSIGDTLWTKAVTGVVEGRSWFNDVVKSMDGGFVAVGVIETGSQDAFVVRTDANGSVSWTKNLGGDKDDFAYSIGEFLGGGGYYICGVTHSFGAGESDNYLFRLKTDGSLDWTKAFGGSGFERGLHVKQDLYYGGLLVVGDSPFTLIKTDIFGELE